MDGLKHLADWIANAFWSLPGSDALAIAILSIGLVFLWSGVAKLRSPWMASLALTDFRLSRSPHRVLGLGAGALELTVSGLLVVAAVGIPALQVPASAAALVLLAFFSLLILRALSRGATFACYCFGGAGDPLSTKTLLRTAALASGAGVTAVACAIDQATVASGARVTATLVATGIVGATVLLAMAPAIATIPPPSEERVAAWTRR